MTPILRRLDAGCQGRVRGDGAGGGGEGGVLQRPRAHPRHLELGADSAASRERVRR